MAVPLDQRDDAAPEQAQASLVCFSTSLNLYHLAQHENGPMFEACESSNNFSWRLSALV